MAKIATATIVYCATNLMDGSEYIGVTCDLARRIREHFDLAKSMRRPTIFSSAVRKYGNAAFHFSVLSTWDSRGEALAEEVRLIAERNPKYNMTDGGDCAVVAHKRAVIRLRDGCRYETVKSAAKANKMSSMRIVQLCQTGGLTKAGETFMYADQSEPPQRVPKTVEQMLDGKRRVLAALARGRATESKPVVCTDTGESFPSVSAAARHHGLHLSSVADAIHRGGRSGGLKFELVGAS